MIENEDNVSKTRRKKDAHALQDLGEKLTQYKLPQLEQLPLTEALRRAITEFQRLPNSFGAQKRQMQYIGKLMRDCDYDEVCSAIETMENQAVHPDTANESSKTICMEILEQGDSRINTLLGEYPSLDRQKLRRLYREYHNTKPELQEQISSRMQKYLLERIFSI